MAQSLDAAVKNLARGSLPFHPIRTKLVRLLLDNPTTPLSPLSPFLAKSLFALKSTDQPLAGSFEESDWKLLRRLDNDGAEALTENLVKLVGHSISTNIGHVNSLIDADKAISTTLFMSDVTPVESTINSLNNIDRQSLFVFHTAAALYSHSHNHIAYYFTSRSHSDWVRFSFLYPLIYTSVGRPSDHFLSDMITHLFPADDTELFERRAVIFLLRPDADWDLSLNARLYISLFFHPFDQLQIIKGWIKQALAKRLVVPGVLLEILEAWQAQIEDPEIDLLISLVHRRPVPFSTNDFPGFSRWPDRSLSEYLQRFFDARSLPPAKSDHLWRSAFHRLRWNSYPSREAFDSAVSGANLYRSTTAGRLMTVMLTSMYMVEREAPHEEDRNLIEQFLLCGVLNPFLMSSPRGAYALSSGLFSLPSGESWVQLETLAENYISNAPESRVWLKAFHYRQRGAERLFRIKPWLAAVRTSLRLKPNSRFLSGVSWHWLDTVIDSMGIDPFEGCPNGIYVLMLRMAEEARRESNQMLHALRPTAKRCATVSGLVDWAVEEFGRESVTFVRTVLSPEMILRLTLEQYYPAALTERLRALERVVELFGLDDEYITGQQFGDEQRTLENALKFMNVGAAQFEIAWTSLKLDALTGARDAYTALIDLDKGEGLLPALALFEKESPIAFHGTTRTYNIRNKDWPRAVLIGQIIDTFLSHPSHGINSILAIRVRHDNFRYELAKVSDELRFTRIKDVPDFNVSALLPVFGPAIDEPINKWVSTHMHTGGGSGDGGDVFNFIPSQADMETLICQCDGALEDIVENVFIWLRAKLDSSLEFVRDSLVAELRPALEGSILARAAAIKAADTFDPPCISGVAAALITRLNMRSDELLEWFRAPHDEVERQLSYGELGQAVDARYRAEKESRALRLRTELKAVGTMQVQPQHVKLVFDIWCEVARNAMKYSRRKRAHLRASPYADDQFYGILFSSSRDEGGHASRSEVGHPFQTANDLLFQSKRSGIVKIAHLAASVAGCPVTVRVEERPGCFHLIVPMIAKAANHEGAD